MSLHLRHLTAKVRLRRPSLVDDGAGGQIQAAPTALRPEFAWASLEPLSSREFLAAGRQEEVTHRARLRYHPEIGLRTRVEWQGRTFEVVSVLNPGLARRELELLLVERPTGGGA
jgi:SPP1 family predicted phage head-tail adaptor